MSLLRLGRTFREPTEAIDAFRSNFFLPESLFPGLGLVQDQEIWMKKTRKWKQLQLLAFRGWGGAFL
jgi:hypothetical protein